MTKHNIIDVLTPIASTEARARKLVTHGLLSMTTPERATLPNVAELKEFMDQAEISPQKQDRILTFGL